MRLRAETERGGKGENEDADENRKASEETGNGLVETCQGSAPLPLSQ